MRQEHPAWDDYQRRRWMRPDDPKYWRQNYAHLTTPEEARLFRPDSEQGSEHPRRQRPVGLTHQERAHLRELLRMRAEVAALRFELRMLELQRKANFNPNQPRVPAGNPDGGQWTSDGGGGVISDASDNKDKVRISPTNELIHDRAGQESWKSYLNEYRPDGSLARQTVFNRDGSAIQSVFSERPDVDGWDERHAVRLADGSGTTFENSGATQTIYDRSGNQLAQTLSPLEDSELPATVQPAFWQRPAIEGARVAVQKTIEAAAVLFTWFSARNGPDQTAVLSYSATDFRSGENNTAVRVGTLTDEELSEACRKVESVQGHVDRAAREARSLSNNWSAAAFGTEVHTQVARAINGRSDAPPYFRSPDDPQDPNYRAEFSILKAAAEDPTARYGQSGTIRVDVLENRGNGTVCVYDIKTGNSVLNFRRSAEIALNVRRRFPDAERIVVVQVKPRR